MGIIAMNKMPVFVRTWWFGRDTTINSRGRYVWFSRIERRWSATSFSRSLDRAGVLYSGSFSKIWLPGYELDGCVCACLWTVMSPNSPRWELFQKSASCTFTSASNGRGSLSRATLIHTLELMLQDADRLRVGNTNWFTLLIQYLQLKQVGASENGRLCLDPLHSAAQNRGTLLS